MNKKIITLHLLLILSSVAAKTKIDPKIGPIQGVHPNAKAIPIKIGLKKFDINICIYTFFII